MALEINQRMGNQQSGVVDCALQKVNDLCEPAAVKQLAQIVSKALGNSGDPKILEEKRCRTMLVLAQHVQETQTSPLSEKAVTEELSALVWVQVDRVCIGKIKSICRGGFSEVWKGVTLDGDLCVLKEGDGASLKRTALYLKRLKESDYIIDLLADNEKCLVESYCYADCEDLYHKVYNQNGGVLTNEFHSEIDQITRELFQSLNDIHSKGIIHSDIKRENILLTKDFHVKISDFGSAVDIGTFIRGGSCQYMAPEQIKWFDEVVLQEKSAYILSEKVDVWQMMLVIASLNKHRLSDPFAARIHEYTQALKGYEEKAEADVNKWVQECIDDSSNPCQTRADVNEREYNLVLAKMGCYTDSVTKYFKSIDEDRVRQNLDSSGLFSDLTPNSSLEKALRNMACFHPEWRYDAQVFKDWVL